MSDVMGDGLATLGEVLGADGVMAPEDSPLAPVLGQVITGDAPKAIAYPRTEAELAAVMACAHQRGWRILPCGQGTKLTWGGLSQGIDLVVSTARLNQVIDHAIGDMTLTAQAGVQIQGLQAQLAQHQQVLAVDPAYGHGATLGGIVATADTGALRQRYGGLRDMLIGVSFVRHDGQVAQAGGRVVKNVAGYDLMKLLTGSYGTLGIISQLTFRLYPVQETSQTVVVTGTAADLQPLVAALGRSPLTPVAFDLLTPALAAALSLPPGFALAVRFQSIAPGVQEQVERLHALMGPSLKGIGLTGQEDAEFWQGLGTLLFPSSETAIANPETQGEVLLKLGLPTTAILDGGASLDALGPGVALGQGHVTSGLGRVRLRGPAATAAAVKTLRSQCQALGGYLTVLEAPVALKQSLDVWGYDGNALPLMKAVKAQFDPHHRLSPGRFVGGI
jgi:glycolate oxidase FAD binding subunit